MNVVVDVVQQEIKARFVVTVSCRTRHKGLWMIDDNRGFSVERREVQ